QGSTTTVSLYESQTGMKLDPTLFEFKNPTFGKPALRNG
ncbi:MAG: outer membrane lipoprotein carrier protein LolA, partial [Rhodospirillaceae bacterium]|nr:outer membrane lipoprotein carrier protein LolA [Rhodospirillales bacterium]